MAIQKSITDSAGVTHAQAYARVLVVQGIQDPFQTLIRVGVYHNAAARSKDAPANTKELLFYDWGNDTTSTYFADTVLAEENKSPLTQAYVWLKAQTDFMGIDWTTGTTDV